MPYYRVEQVMLNEQYPRNETVFNEAFGID